MFLSQHRLLLAAAVISESASVFAILGVVGLASGLGGSPVPWTTVIGVLGASLLVARVGPSNVRAVELVYLVRAPAWAVLGYVAVGSLVTPDSTGVDLLWIFTLIAATGPEGFSIRAFEASFAVALLLWRGIGLGTGSNPLENLTIGFKIGLLPIAIAATVDILHPADLHVFPIIFVFFAAGLAGLSIGNLMPESQESAQARTWLKVIAGVIPALILIGLLFTLVHKGLSSLVSGPLGAAFDALGQALSSVVSTLLSLVVDTLDNLGARFFKPEVDLDALAAPFRPEDVTSSPTVEPFLAFGTEIYCEATGIVVTLSTPCGEGDSGPAVPVIGDWVALASVGLVVLLVALVAVGIAVVLVRLLKRSAARVRASRGEAESLKPEAVPERLSDIAGLVPKLMPEWLKKRRRKAGLQLPDGPPGVVSALKIYYELLALAEDRGIARLSHQTAVEFQRTLEGVFTGNLVRMATEAFNRACYGNYPASDEQITQMRAALASLKSAVRALGRRAQGRGTLKPEGGP